MSTKCLKFPKSGRLYAHPVNMFSRHFVIVDTAQTVLRLVKHTHRIHSWTYSAIHRCRLFRTHTSVLRVTR